jgi:hypothetical protein
MAMQDDNKPRRGIGEALAAAGVIASLIFVAVEIRQNTEAVRGATTQAVAQQSMDLVFVGLDNPEIRDAFAAATREDELSPQQERVLMWFFQAKLRADENRFRQVQLGILDESTFGQLSSNTAYRLPFFAEWWSTNGFTFEEDFQTVVEREFLPLSGTTPLPSAR